MRADARQCRAGARTVSGLAALCCATALSSSALRFLAAARSDSRRLTSVSSCANSRVVCQVLQGAVSG